jgi:hypothetical protein
MKNPKTKKRMFSLRLIISIDPIAMSFITHNSSISSSSSECLISSDCVHSYLTFIIIVLVCLLLSLEHKKKYMLQGLLAKGLNVENLFEDEKKK